MTDKLKKETIVSIRNLNISFPGKLSEQTVVKNVNLDIQAGEIIAVVGESGSGKTMIGRSILGLLPDTAILNQGEIFYDSKDLLQLNDACIRKIRGKEIGMIFQEPLISLNPSMKVGEQIAEAALLHTTMSPAEIRQASIDILLKVRIKDPESCLDRYPHEFSGGMRQRIMIASVMLLKPRLLIADEPTTALDAVVQKEVLDIMQELVKSMGSSVLLISHDLGLVARYADKIAVMEKGLIVEFGTSKSVLSNPQHSYTKALLCALPSGAIGKRTENDKQILLSAHHVSVDYPLKKKWPFSKQRYQRAVQKADLTIHKGEFLGLVGESGSGKSSLGRALIKLVNIAEGDILFKGKNIHKLPFNELKSIRKDLQIIFQDPYSSLNPRMKVSDLIGEGLRHSPEISRQDRQQRVEKMLLDVGLDLSFCDRYSHEMSGGQRQRVSIARAIISKPQLIIADEAVSALDVTVQAQILTLLCDLRETYGFACLFISHDLAVVESICDRVLVMYQGHILEEADTRELYQKPYHPYTCRLMNAIPILKKNASNSYQLHEENWQAMQAPNNRQYFEKGPEETDREMFIISKSRNVALCS